MGNGGGIPHRKLRSNCKWCPRNGHNHTVEGDTHRFHGKGAFCRTHKNKKNPVVRRYCGIGRTKSRRK